MCEKTTKDIFTNKKTILQPTSNGQQDSVNICEDINDQIGIMFQPKTVPAPIVKNLHHQHSCIKLCVVLLCPHLQNNYCACASPNGEKSSSQAKLHKALCSSTLSTL